MRNLNSPDILLSLGSNENTKALGLQWCPKSDLLSYQVDCTSLLNTVSKRSILSGIAQIFDPLGLLSPVVITVKILMQQLWLEKLDWDQSVPLDIQTKWLHFRDNLFHLNDLSIPRHTILKNSIRREIHGFSDASESAYGALIYIRSVDNHGNTSVNLLCAKSRVAPLKKISVPRLELCGALILSQLVDKVNQSLNIDFHERFFWTDSTIVLGWIKTPSHLLKTFVGNRVSEIQSKTNITNWRHIGTTDNPADLLSRGINPSILSLCDLWWHGPTFLVSAEDRWPARQFDFPKVPPETKSLTKSLVLVNSFKFQFERFSSLTKLTRLVAYWLRFRHNALVRDNSLRWTGSLTSVELRSSIRCLTKLVQLESFADETSRLKEGRLISSKSKLVSLNPFLDEAGVIRVGGRLRHSHFDFDKKHPMLLPARHPFTTLVFRSTHFRLFHAGPQHLLSVVRETFWPINGKSAAKQTVRPMRTVFSYEAYLNIQ
ncbi:uncharacterized protein [Diabrotica undecimpunctata]|uniref:uncharacterized protein n=1 Tax=Diabrotica undecimpunctata TaxID=50387 RepID=UPI003B63BCB5